MSSMRSFLSLRVEVTNPTGEIVDGHDYNEARFGFQPLDVTAYKYAIVIDLDHRSVTEELGAGLDYRIYEGDTQVLHAYTDAGGNRYFDGGGERCRTGAVMTISF